MSGLRSTPRECRYCGTNISSMRISATVCRAARCRGRRRMEGSAAIGDGRCIYCGADISAMRVGSTTCRTRSCMTSRDMEAWRVKNQRTCLHCAALLPSPRVIGHRDYCGGECFNARQKKLRAEKRKRLSAKLRLSGQYFMFRQMLNARRRERYEADDDYRDRIISEVLQRTARTRNTINQLRAERKRIRRILALTEAGKVFFMMLTDEENQAWFWKDRMSWPT
jgi:hypothetical protein